MTGGTPDTRGELQVLLALHPVTLDTCTYHVTWSVTRKGSDRWYSRH